MDIPEVWKKAFAAIHGWRGHMPIEVTVDDVESVDQRCVAWSMVYILGHPLLKRNAMCRLAVWSLVHGVHTGSPAIVEDVHAFPPDCMRTSVTS